VILLKISPQAYELLGARASEYVCVRLDPQAEKEERRRANRDKARAEHAEWAKIVASKQSGDQKPQ
jgi:hypothetical protein